MGLAMLRLSALRLAFFGMLAFLLLTGQVSTPSLSVQVEVPGVPPSALETNGMAFLHPEATASPLITGDQARKLAEATGTTWGLPISQTVLVRLVDVNAIPAMDQLVWVNVMYLDPATDYRPVPPNATKAQRGQTYYLIFIDAMNGEWFGDRDKLGQAIGEYGWPRTPDIRRHDRTPRDHSTEHLPELFQMSRRRIMVVAVPAALLSLAGVCALLFLYLRSSSPQVEQAEIPGVDAESLARAGITLLPPDGTPSITSQQAREVAARGRAPDQQPEAPTYLVRLVQSEEAPAVDRLSWVYIVDLGRTPWNVGGPYGITAAQMGRPYLLIFVDAHTGEYLGAYRG